MATQPHRSNWRDEILDHVAKARALAKKYELDRSNPTADFTLDPEMDAEFERLLNKLS